MKADVKDFGDIFSYVSEKTDDLLDSGIEKVLWILTESQKILIAEQGKQWIIAKWNDTIKVPKCLKCLKYFYSPQL